jgi:hypothetical protein
MQSSSSDDEESSSEELKPRFEIIETDVEEKKYNLRRKMNRPAEHRRIPDLPMITIPTTKSTTPSITIIPKEENLRNGVKVKLFRAAPGSNPLAYEFKAWEKTVSWPD